jgi:hypothetical protein
MSWESIRELARNGKGPDPDGHRGEFLTLIDKAATMVDRAQPAHKFKQ